MRRSFVIPVLVASMALCGCSAPAAESVIQISESVSETETDLSGDFFTSVQGEYITSSGAGAWYESLYIEADGSFKYESYDSDNDTCYICSATGHLGNVTCVSDYVYTVEVIDMEFETTEGNTWQEGSGDATINYVAIGSEDLTTGTVLTYYKSGIDTASLPEDYISWYTMPSATPLEEVPDKFPVSGFYNESELRAFIDFD